MHNHLISFAQYEKATDTLTKANQELDRIITDILLVNKSQYLNDVNIIDAISVFIKALGLAAQAVKESPLVKAIQLFAEYLEENADAEQGNLSVDPNPEEEHDEKLDDQ